MFRIGKIEQASYYIDRIMDDMSNYAQKTRDEIERRWENNLSTKRKDPETVKLEKRKDLELQKIRFINEHVNRDLRKIHKRFPNFVKVDQVYHELINTSPTNLRTIKESLSTLMWITQRCDELTQQSEMKIKYAKTHQTIGFIMKKYLGRVNSLFSKQKKVFGTLDEARRFMEKLPQFQDMYTVSITGFPNVGKSTLMKKITGSDVEIQNYPFTTKGLMFGYITHNQRKAIQLIDTPGLLGRKKNNDIEKRAEIVLRNYCDSIVFVLDITESCGYSVDQQLKLLKSIRTTEKPLVIYLSKQDIYGEEDEEMLEEIKPKLKKNSLYFDSDKLLKKLVELSLDKKKVFDPSKVKVIR